MGKKAPQSPAPPGGGTRRSDSGRQLLRELEALSQVLYNAGPQNIGTGRPPRKESPSSPFLGTLPPPRRSQESPHLPDRAYRAPPSPRLGTIPTEESSSASSSSQNPTTQRSPYLTPRNGNGPPSPHLMGLDGPEPEPRSPVLASGNGSSVQKSGSRQGKPPMVAPPHVGQELAKSPLLVARRSVDNMPLLPPRSPHPSRGALQGPFARTVSEPTPSARSLASLNITEQTLSSAAAALRSPHQRPPAHARSFSPLSQSADLGKEVESYRLDGGRESESSVGESLGAKKPWHSQSFEKIAPEVTNFPQWLDDNVQFSKQLVVRKEKRSLWHWGPFKALAHMKAQRFNCMFTVHVHGIEGLPAVTNGLRLAVSWKRKEAQAQSMAGRVFQGAVEFEESLYLKSTVYGTKDGSKGLKFEQKCFDLAVIALDVDELVLGKHRLDLSRLLPKTAEGRREENDRSWTTSFKLAGKAKGGTLIVTFGCQLLNKNSEPTSSLVNARLCDSPSVKPLRSYNSSPSSPDGAFSPAMSEMPMDGEYMKMEHLSLNDDYESGRFSSSKSSQKGDARPSFSGALESARKLSYSQQAAAAEREDLAKALYDEDDGYEFNVVCQGHETSAIVDSGPTIPVTWDDPKAEEDVVEGLSDGDGHDDLLEDSAFLPPPIPGASETVEVLSEEKALRNEEAGVRSAQVVEVGGDDVDESPQVGEGVVVDDQSPGAAAEPGVGQKDGEISVAIESLKDGGKEAEVIEGQEDWSLSVVEDLDALTSSWSVGVRAGNPDEDIGISREEEILYDDEKGDENTTSVAIVESKSDDERGTNEIVVEQDEEEEENSATNVGIVEQGEEEEKKATTNVAIVGQGEDEEKKATTVVIEGSKDEREDERATSLGVAERDVSDEKKISIELAPAPQVEAKHEDVEDDDYDLVTGEFLSLLRGERSPAVDRSESGEEVPDSPRALLLQQFEQEALVEGGLELNFHLPEYVKFTVEGAQEKNDENESPPDSPKVPDNTDNHLDWGNEDDEELAAILEAAEAELEKATQILKSKARAKMLEDEETKALMEEWGLNDNAFASPQTEQESDFSLAIVPVASAPAPPLGNGLGHVMRIRDGGSVRSMSPTPDAQLLLQASDPVVVGATSSDTGATSLEMLRRMALAGMEGMAAQAMMAMPLEDLSGMALDQIPVNEQRPAGFSQPLGSHSQNGYAAVGYGENITTLALRDNISSRFNKRSGSAGNWDDEHLGLEDLAPTAMLKIEALALEGLKIQAEMADQDAPYNIEPLADEANRHKSDSQRGIPLLESGNPMRDHSAGDGGLMSSTVSLNEWMRLDAGVCDEEDSEEQTMVHNKKRQSASKGVMGDTVTLSMLVQLRDPFRSNEAVGAPMMALVQAERVKAPPKPILGHRFSRKGLMSEEKEESAEPAKFKIVDVTVAGLETTDANSPTRKLDPWNRPKQLAAGTRWLVAHGLTKPSSKSSLRTKPAATPVKAQRDSESLWSISARVHGSGAKWRDSHIRNPNVIFADTSIQTY